MKKSAMYWLSVIFVLIGASSYGFVSSIVKLAFAEGYSTAQVTISQISVGAAVLWIMVLLRPHTWRNPFAHGGWKLLFVGIFGLSLTTIFYNSALQQLDASLAIILLFQFTWITLVMECVTHRTWPNRYQWLSIFIVLLGTVLAVGITSDNLERFTFAGIVLGLASAITYSLFLYLTGKIQTHHDPVMRSAMMMTGTLPVIYGIYVPFIAVGMELPPDVGHLLLWGLLLGSLSHIIPTVTFNIGIPRIGSSLASMICAMELPVVTVVAYVLLHEQVTLLQWLGILLILAGIVIAEQKAKRITVDHEQ
ncbi:DMT family transporter [Paenibacillus sp. ACRRX]|uniref:EamA family transporter n=1 Tax=Paenibacillus sp. ACRRX TaxID=2918206 RepID=UPI001EF5F6E6|nr:DMT family transporter [Paenibacillus sp. ACRRX]MCG7410811.1 DMT family transporter [Paenibacillus sp. ACRRX]